MSSTSQKHRNFVSEPMGKKRVTALAGIGAVQGERLSNKGYTQASQVFGQYLMQGQNKEKFTSWLKDTSNANKKQAADCHQCLSEWSKEFM